MFVKSAVTYIQVKLSVEMATNAICNTKGVLPANLTSLNLHISHIWTFPLELWLAHFLGKRKI